MHPADPAIVQPVRRANAGPAAGPYELPALCVPCPYPYVQNPERRPRRRNLTGGVDVDVALRLIAERPEAARLLAIEVQFGHVLQAQHHRLFGHPLFRLPQCSSRMAHQSMPSLSKKRYASVLSSAPSVTGQQLKAMLLS